MLPRVIQQSTVRAASQVAIGAPIQYAGHVTKIVDRRTSARDGRLLLKIQLPNRAEWVHGHTRVRVLNAR